MGERWIHCPGHPHADEFNCVPAELYHSTDRKSIQIIKDIEPVKSPIDGTILGSRRDIREHEKRHGVRALGNDWCGAERPKHWDQRHEIARTGKVPE